MASTEGVGLEGLELLPQLMCASSPSYPRQRAIAITLASPPLICSLAWDAPEPLCGLAKHYTKTRHLNVKGKLTVVIAK